MDYPRTKWLMIALQPHTFLLNKPQWVIIIQPTHTFPEMIFKNLILQFQHVHLTGGLTTHHQPNLRSCPRTYCLSGLGTTLFMAFHGLSNVWDALPSSPTPSSFRSGTSFLLHWIVMYRNTYRVLPHQTVLTHRTCICPDALSPPWQIQPS